jgi:Zn-dependent oligopeptidase
MKRIKIRVEKFQHKDSPAFASWCCDSLKAKDGTILLNVDAILKNGWINEKGKTVRVSKKDRTRVLITCLMHEFGHALEEAMGLNHSELRMHKNTNGFYT